MVPHVAVDFDPLAIIAIPGIANSMCLNEALVDCPCQLLLDLILVVGGNVSDINHAVWSVYDKLRTARLNVKYYGRRLGSLERQSFWTDFVMLASAPSSAIAGLWFWADPIGALVWKWFAVIAAVTSIVKPLLGLTKKIKDFESVLSGYRILEFDLMELKTMIEQRSKYDGMMQGEFKKALIREKTLVGKTPESAPIDSVRALCQKEVELELPVGLFYVPQAKE